MITQPEYDDWTARLRYYYDVDSPKVRPLRPATKLDTVGEVEWNANYRTLRDGGMPHEQAAQKLLNDIWAIEHPTPAPPVVARPGVVKLKNRGFVDDAGPFCAAVFTDMSALRLFEQFRVRHDQNGREMFARGADAGRILGMVGWPGREINPRRADYTDLLRECIKARYAQGLRTELTMFADCHVLGMAMPERRTHAQKTAKALKGLEHMLLFIEGCNEPGVSNYNGPWTLAELIEIGRIVKAELPNVLYACGAPFTPPDGGTTWDDASYQKLGNGADLTTPHFDRDISKHDSVYRPIRQTIDGQNYGYPFSNNEPIGVDSSVASEKNPGRLRAAATFSWVSRGAEYCYHTAAGVGVNNDQLIAAQPGADVVFDAKRILSGDAPQFSFSNWHWAENVWETVDGSLSDKALSGRGTMRTISGVHADGRVQTSVLLVTAGATLKARKAMELDVWKGGESGPYQKIDHIKVTTGQTYELHTCVDTIFVGKLL